MRSPIRFACLGLLAVGLTSALPFEAIDSQRGDARAPVESRAYAVINVDGTSNIDGASDVQELQRRAPAKSYSVVNVDGGSPSTSEAAQSVTTKTVAEPTTISPTETVVHTQDTTIVVTETQHPAPSITQTVVYTTTIIASPTTAHNTSVSVSVVTLPPSVVTVTATQTDTTSYYDNGMWHTSYAIKTFPTVSPS